MLTGPYRGAGRPEAAYVLETLVDLAARKLDIDPAELRRRNTIPEEAMPFKTALVYTYDCGDFGKNLDDCLDMADYKGFEARRREFVEARQAARPRHLQHRRSVERRPDRACRAALRSVRRAHRRDGHARPRPGPRHRVPADHRRQARHPARPRALPVRRHRPDRDRHRHLRLALDGLRRHRAADGRRQDHRQGQEARGAHAGSRRARHRVREGQVHRRRHRQDDRPRRGRQAVVQPEGAAAGHGSRHVRERHLRRRRAHLSERLPHRRGRDRRGDRRRSRSCAITRSTTSAT